MAESPRLDLFAGWATIVSKLVPGIGIPMATSKPQPLSNFGEPSGERLDSWKEIAAYLKRDERTVRRWEKEGLPVRRKVHHKQASVFAYRAEIDAWWNDGRQRLKETPTLLKRGWPKIWLTITVAGLVTAGTFLSVASRWRSASVARKIRSIAVLPLRNLSGTSEYDFLADSLTDELTTNIARISSLRVVSSTSTKRFRDTAVPLPQIARQLNVDAIVEGSVVRLGNRVRITTQLVDARTDAHLWAQSYERELGEILEIQDAVALDIADKVRANLAPGEREFFQSRRAVVPEAYEAYLKGIYFLNKQTADDSRSGIRYFRAAIGRDREFAPAYARLADCYMFLAQVGEMSSSEAFSRAQEEAARALALDENLDDAHVDLANIAFFGDWDWKKAETEFKRAIELNPNSAHAHQAYTVVQQIWGRPEESAKEVRAARETDPVSLPTLAVVVVNLYFARQYDEGLRQAKAALELYPDAPILHVFLSNIYLEQGQLKQSAEEVLRTEELWDAAPERIAGLRKAAQSAGLSGLLRKRIELNKGQAGQKLFNAYDIAVDYATLGDKDQAVYWLEKAYRVREPKLLLIGVEPKFDNLRSDSRFAELTQRIGLELPK